jgi:hypothetical protein
MEGVLYIQKEKLSFIATSAISHYAPYERSKVIIQEKTQANIILVTFQRPMQTLPMTSKQKMQT